MLYTPRPVAYMEFLAEGFGVLIFFPFALQAFCTHLLLGEGIGRFDIDGVHARLWV